MISLYRAIGVTVLLASSVLGGAAMAQDRPPFPIVGDTAANFELAGLDGAKTSLFDLAAQGPVVVVVLRGYPGYQCPICSAQVGQFLPAANKLAAAKATLVFVYPGASDNLAKHAADFIKGKDLPANVRLLLDPDYAFTNAYKLRWDAKNETAYPSTFVVDKDRKVAFAKVSTGHGNRAKLKEVLAALTSK